MQCSKSLLKGEQTYSAPLNWHSHCTSSFSRQLVCESSVANGASAWSLVRMVVGGAMRVDCLICDRWVFLSFSFPLFSPPVSRPSLSVLSTVSFFFFAFTIPHYVLRCGSVDEWHIHSSAEDFRTQRCVCAVKLSASLLGCLLACASWSLLLEVSRIKWHVGTAYS